MTRWGWLIVTIEGSLCHQLVSDFAELGEQSLDGLHPRLGVPVAAGVVGRGEVVVDVVKVKELAELRPEAGPAITEHHGRAVKGVQVLGDVLDDRLALLVGCEAGPDKSLSKRPSPQGLASSAHP